MRRSHPPPTQRQIQILRFVARGIAAGLPPTVREIREHLGVRGTNGIADHLRALQVKGLIVVEPHKSRAIRLTARGRVFLEPFDFRLAGVPYRRVLTAQLVAPSEAA